MAKAFDNVWHNGLLYKMNQMKMPKNLGFWIKQFLSERKFFIKLNQASSQKLPIEASTPQGSILSPTLFSIFINDIIDLNTFPNNIIKSLLFADDLFSISWDYNNNFLRLSLEPYLDHLEIWLNKWRLCIAAHKCSFNIYKKGQLPKEIKNGSFKLKIFGEEIPLEVHPKYLGIYLDKNCNFNLHVDNIVEKCKKLLNILKSLYFKDWALDTNSQLNIYKTLIRANMEYASPLIIMSD